MSTEGREFSPSQGIFQLQHWERQFPDALPGLTCSVQIWGRVGDIHINEGLICALHSLVQGPGGSALTRVFILLINVHISTHGSFRSKSSSYLQLWLNPAPYKTSGKEIPSALIFLLIFSAATSGSSCCYCVQVFADGFFWCASLLLLVPAS